MNELIEVVVMSNGNKNKTKGKNKPVIFWDVIKKEGSNRKWVPMPSVYLGTPLFEHETDYITLLQTGERVMVRKEDGYIFENKSEHRLSPEEVAVLKEEARARYQQVNFLRSVQQG